MSAEPRSYVVETETGQYRRNRNFLLQTRENIVLPQIEEPEPENELKATPSTGRATPTIQYPLPTPTEAQEYRTTRGRTIKMPAKYKDVDMSK